MDGEEFPEDVLEDLEGALGEARREEGVRGRRRLPSNRDVAAAVAEAAYSAAGMLPEEFPELARRLLEARGFTSRYVNDRRIWRIYEELVKRKSIPDTLGVSSR